MNSQSKVLTKIGMQTCVTELRSLSLNLALELHETCPSMDATGELCCHVYFVLNNIWVDEDPHEYQDAEFPMEH